MTLPALKGSDEEYAELVVDALEEGECILLVGSGVDIVDAEGNPYNLAKKLGEALASGLERNFDKSASLPYIAQVYASKIGSGRKLAKKVKRFIEKADAPLSANCVFSKLAELPFPIIVTTRHDRTLDRYLEAAGKTPQTVCLDVARGHSPQIPRDFSARKPLVFHLAGDLDEPDSLIITEDHILDMVKKITAGNPSLPARLKHQFEKDSMISLLVGFGVPKWYTRVILDELGMPRKAPECSFALGEFDTFGNRYADWETAYYYDDEYNIKTILGDIDELVGRVVDEWKSRGSPLPGGDEDAVADPDGPYVFISYCSDDRGPARRIHQALGDAGIPSFFDDADMRSGDYWRDRLRRELERATEVVLVVSPTLHADKQRVTHFEAREAWTRSGDANYLFLHPVWVSGETRPYEREGTGFDRLSHYSIDDEAGLEKLVESIKKAEESRTGGVLA